jgi:hypothetical protein
MTIAASGLVLGYLASSWASSSALRFGFARDFILASLLGGIVGVCLLVPWVYRSVFRRGGSLRLPGTTRALSPSRACVAVTAASVLLLVAGLVVTKTYGLPRVDSRHLATLEYTATCAPETCRVEIAATNDRGESVDVPTTSLLTFGCGSEEPKFTLYVPDPEGGVAIPESCTDPRLVAAWPTIMGVPPSSDVLRAVGVSNA